MARKRKDKSGREVSKRQLARWQQERKRQHIILGLGVLVIVAVLGVTGVGWYLSEYQPLHQTVIRVNDTEFDMNYYVKMLRYYGGGQPVEYLYALADEVVTIIEGNELVQQGARKKLGITVSDDAVDEALKGYDPPLSEDYRDLVRTDLLTRKLRDEHFGQAVPVSAEQRHIWAMFLESERQANEVRARLEGGEDFAELAGELSLESFSKAENGDLGWRPKGILAEFLGSTVPEEYAFGAEAGVLSQPVYDETAAKQVGYWLVEVLERKAGTIQAKVRGMLLGSEEEAQRMKERLEGTESFGELATEFSRHEESKDSGGELGWFSPGEAGPAFEQFVFNPEVEIDAVSEPIFDDVIAAEGGYWLLKVLERKEEPEEAHIRVMLLASQEQAETVRARLEAGDEFGEMAKEFSQDDGSKEEGGDLDWIIPGMLSATMDEFVFDPEVESGTLSEPIHDDTLVTRGGYWLIEVVEIEENRQIAEEDRDLLTAKAMNEWLLALWDDPENEVEDYLDAEKMAWAISRVAGSQN